MASATAVTTVGAVVGVAAGDPASAKAQEKFFFRTLEDREVYQCTGCCLDHKMPWKN